MGAQGHQRSKVHPQALKQTKLATILLPALEKIVKTASNRKHLKLVEECRAVIDWFGGEGSCKAKQLNLKPLELPTKIVPGLTTSPTAESESTNVISTGSFLGFGRQNSLTCRGSRSSVEINRDDIDDMAEVDCCTPPRQSLSATDSSDFYRHEEGLLYNAVPFSFALEQHQRQISDSGESLSEAEVRKGEDGVTSSCQLDKEFEDRKIDSGASQSNYGCQKDSVLEALSAPSSPGSREGSMGDLNTVKSNFRTVTLAPSGLVLYDEDQKGFTLQSTEMILKPLISACKSGCMQISEPALGCLYKLLARKHLQGEVSNENNGFREARVLFKVFDSVFHCVGLAEENSALEIPLLKVLLSASCSSVLILHGDVLLMVVRACFRVATRSKTPLNQLYAKASLGQILAVMMARVDADSLQAHFQPIVVTDLVALVERPASEWAMVQNFVSEVVGEERKVMEMESSLSSMPVSRRAVLPMQTMKAENMNGSLSASQESTVEALFGVFGETQDMKYMNRRVADTGMFQSSSSSSSFFSSDHNNSLGSNVDILNDAYTLLEELCKVSMKSPGSGKEIEVAGLREKTLALELICLVLEIAGTGFLRSQRFLALIRRTLLLSLVENSTLPLMTVFQLSCSIFLRLLSVLRSSLKFEIGEFFSILVLKPLEQLQESNRQQKLIVLRLVESICIDPQIWVDLYVNYDCDVDSNSAFEGLVSALLKMTISPAPAAGSLAATQDLVLKIGATRCLDAILRSLALWTSRQIHMLEGGGPPSPKPSETGSDLGSELMTGFDRRHIEGENLEVLDIAPEFSGEVATFEQRKAYKRELKDNIALFNKNPIKGMCSLVEGHKVGSSPKDKAEFLKTQSGLDKTKIGEYLGDNDKGAMDVLQAYVQLFDFQGLEIDEGIRQLLKDFRLPGEAQKIERIMETFAEHYFDCNQLSFTSAVTAHVLAYSVIMLNTDAHNSRVRTKMTKAEFVRNNRGIDQGKDLSYELLASLYDRIINNEIKMREDPLMATSSKENKLNRTSSRVAKKMKEVRRLQNAADVVRMMQERFQARSINSSNSSESRYYSPTDHEIVRAMLSSTWAMFMAGFESVLEKADVAKLMRVHVLEGYKEALRLCLLLGMVSERDIVFTSLNRFTMATSTAHGRSSGITKVSGKGRSLFVCCSNGANGLDYQALMPRTPTVFDSCYSVIELCLPKAR